MEEISTKVEQQLIKTMKCFVRTFTDKLATAKSYHFVITKTLAPMQGDPKRNGESERKFHRDLVLRKYFITSKYLFNSIDIIAKNLFVTKNCKIS